MPIQLKQLRVHGFRGLDNLEIDFEPTTVLVGTNNAGKTTLLKSLQLCLSNTLQITDDDFHFTDAIIRDKIVIDVLFISVNEEGIQIAEFEDKWSTVFTVDRISIGAATKKRRIYNQDFHRSRIMCNLHYENGKRSSRYGKDNEKEV